MSKLAQDIILRPIITENSMDGIADRKYTFQVAIGANKTEGYASGKIFMPILDSLCKPGRTNDSLL